MESNVILKYKRACDSWLCPECDSENDITAPYCTVCGSTKPASPVIINAWSEKDERPPAGNFAPMPGVSRTAKTARTTRTAKTVSVPSSPGVARVYVPAPPKKKKSGGKAVAIIIIILLIAAIIAGTAFFIYNNISNYSPDTVEIDSNEEAYSEAMDEFESGNYEKALELFEGLPSDYEDVAEMIDKSKYQNALRLMEEDKFDEAKAIFEELEDYSDSADKVNECVYKKAEKLMSDDKYMEAKELFDSIPDYNDSSSQSTRCHYNYAIELLDSGNYEDAEAIFNDLGNYENSDYYLNECVYARAEDYTDNNKFVEALQLLYEHTDGNLNDSDFISAQNALVSYNKSRKYFTDEYSIIGSWKSGSDYMNYYSNDNGGVALDTSMPFNHTSTFTFENGVHYQMNSYSKEIQWVVQYVSSSSIKVFNYRNGKIYNFTKN